jgi:subtilisin family serine protease
MDFRKKDGTTRIRYLWDQTLNAGQMQQSGEWEYAPPEGFQTGVEFTAEQINEALQAATEAEGFQIVPSIDVSGHGTAVAGIAAGNGNNSGGIYAGVAPESELLIVKLGMPRAEGFPRTTELMRALTYVVRKSLALQMPVAINLSFGNTYGAHEPYN